MKTEFSHTRERKPIVHRLLRRPVLPALTFVPVLTLAVMNPGVALADDAVPQEDSIPQGIVTFYDEPLSSEDADSSESATDFSYNYSLDTYDDGFAISGEGEIEAIASEQNPTRTYDSTDFSSNSSEIAENSRYDSGKLAQNSDSLIYSVNEIKSSSTLFTNADKFLSSQSSPNTIIDDSGSSQSNAPSGDIVIYDPHQALLVFTTSSGGTIVEGTKTSVSAGEGVDNVSQTYENSLMGNSSGATAVPDAGYHFVYWLDTSTNKPISTSVNFSPDRPASGWPVQWIIKAVFALDVYQIILDPNGGVSTGGGGGGSSGAIYLGEVEPGSEFQLPGNGSSDVSFAKAGCTFTGWNAVAHPDSQSASGFSLSDGQSLDSSTEKDLENKGFLVTGKNIPTLILYAQWLANQVAIEYQTDSTGGAVSLYSDRSKSGASYTKETLLADSGIHPDKSVSAGPEGAVAIVDTGHHFAGWKVIGSEQQLSDAEASNANLPSSVVSRVSYYPSTVPNIGEYHDVSFLASFAPNTYIVVYDANGGEGSIESEDYVYGSTSITAASTGVTRDGYELTGWNLSSNGNSVSLGLGSSIDSSIVQSMVSSGLVADKNESVARLYAQWTPISSPNPEDPDDPSNNESGESSNGSSSGSGSEGSSGQTGSSSSDTVFPVAGGTGMSATRAAASAVSSAVSSADASVLSPAVALPALATGLLAAAGGENAFNAAVSGPLEVFTSYSDMTQSSFAGTSSNEDFLSSLMSPGGVQEAGTTVAAVAVVGALASLVGVGVSVAGAVMVGAATIGTAGAIGLSSAADLAADLAAAGAAGAAGAAANRRRRDENDGEEQVETQQ